MRKREGMSAQHLDLVRDCPCCVCRSDVGRSQPHHLLIKEERGAGMKATDQWVIPMCAKCHSDIHKHGSRKHTEWLRERDVDDRALAETLWHVSNRADYLDRARRMRAAVFSHMPLVKP